MHVKYAKYNIYNGKPKGKDICDPGVDGRC
jgi:hypothetical protein